MNIHRQASLHTLAYAKRSYTLSFIVAEDLMSIWSVTSRTLKIERYEHYYLLSS